MGLGLSLKYYRLKAGIKQKDLARQVGTSVAYLSLIETEKRGASLDLLTRIGDRLGVPVELLLLEAKEASGRLSPRQIAYLQRAKRLILLATSVERYADKEEDDSNVTSR